MPEGMNIELAHKLAEQEGEELERSTEPRLEILEIAEAVVLAVVAVATAWSGYCSAQWDGQQTYLYGQSTRFRVEAAEAREEGVQTAMFDGLTLNAWLDAKHRGDEALAAVYPRRFTPEFRKVFDAWVKTDPIHNENAPVGPYLMEGYRNPGFEKSEQLGKSAHEAFEAGTKARENAEKYVRITVVLATVLFLIAIAQRFKIRRVRFGLFVMATCLMLYATITVAMYPRL